MSRARQSVTVVTAPTILPVDFAAFCDWARIDSSESQPLLESLLAAATEAAQQFLGRSLITQTLKLTLDLAASQISNYLGEGTYELPVSVLYGALPRIVRLPRGNIQSVGNVTTYSLTNASSVYSDSNYTVDTAGSRLVLNYNAIWPANMRAIAACEVEYDAGYGDKATDVPQAIRHGIMIHAASLYEQRGQSADAMSIPPGARQLYSQYRLIGGTIA